MENAADALKMAAAILIFIIAIASAFSLFGIAKQTADSIIKMRDKQAYLEAAELESVLYTSSSAIEKESVSKMTKEGYRIVGVEDVISTIYRYNKEDYGVTIVEKNSRTVLARYDTGTESDITRFNTINSSVIEDYERKLENNTKTTYVTPKFEGELARLYKVDTANSNIKYGAPWFGNPTETRKRINADIAGEKYENLNQTRILKDGLLELLRNKKIVEVTNEIDRSQYLSDNGQTTELMQQYEMPTVEVVYIILDD